MNNQRRKDIQTAMSLLEEANAILDAAKRMTTSPKAYKRANAVAQWKKPPTIWMMPFR